MDNSAIQKLLDRYLAGSCSESERLIVESWLEQQPGTDNRWTEMDGPAKAEWMSLLYKDIQQTITTDKKPAPVIPFYKRPLFRTAAAAAVILIIGMTALYKKHTPSGAATATAVQPPPQQDVPPGGNKAILMLANGANITLDSASNGALAQQGNTTVLKTANGQLAYNTGNNKPAEILYNTLVTPRGGQYQLVLPDGTKVWLNAASPIRYPTAFAGKERKVSVTGEAYFEVAQNAAMPFVVSIGATGNKGEIMVLGTHFNVNAYDDEETVRTTLLEGAIEMKKDDAKVFVKPMQQAQLSKTGDIRLVNDVDVEDVIAWKNGKTSCKNMELKDIMREVSRWYDVDIVYENAIEDRYTVTVPRDVPVSSLFKFLEASGGVHFKIEGKKITVLK